jgi:S1-C subfamily serine protease
MDTHQYETAAAPVDVAHAARRGRTRRIRIGAGALLAVGAVVAVHAAATPQTPSDAVMARPHWSGTVGADYSGRWPGAGSGSLRQVTTATDAQQTGVVDIDVVLGGTQRAAGTGMVLTANGEVLTNRHVVDGETAMTVTIPATGRTYDAHVVGMARDTDVAVVQLEDASGLDTVKTSSGSVSVGDAVVGVGNAGGQGGRPSAAPGVVTGVDRSITATDESGSNPEQLTGLIETDAAIQPGDSGGPLMSASDEVVGMDTAGSSDGGDGYAIPIAAVLDAAKQIEAGGSAQSGSGQSGSGQSQTQAGGAYLGVEVQDGPMGAQVTVVVDGSPATRAGLTAGDTITSVAGRSVASVTDLASAMAALAPGQVVDVTFAGPDGTGQSSRTTLTAAPTT